MIVLITGTSSGIGKATALYFLERGHEVHGMDIAECSIDHKDYNHHIVDVTKPESFDDVMPAGFEPEIVINNAGIQSGEMIAREELEVNLMGMINVTERYAIGNDKIKSVVNIGSAAGHTGSEFPVYAASKGGVAAYTKNVALRLAPRAICNSIDPGGVITDINTPVMQDEKLWNRIMELTPLKRWAEPEEIAEWVYFVAVNNRFMTGQNLLIDGGEAGKCEFVWPE